MLVYFSKVSNEDFLKGNDQVVSFFDGKLATPRVNYVVFGVEFIYKLNRSMPYLFSTLYGISRKQMYTLGLKLGASLDTPVSSLTYRHSLCFFQLLWQFGSSKLFLFELENSSLALQCQIASRRGYRYLHGLPVRGQRTHTNAKACRSPLFHKRIMSLTHNG